MAVLIGRRARSVTIAAVTAVIVRARRGRDIDRTATTIIAIAIVIIGIGIGGSSGAGNRKSGADNAGDGSRAWIEAAAAGADIGHATGGSSEALAGRSGQGDGRRDGGQRKRCRNTKCGRAGGRKQSFPGNHSSILLTSGPKAVAG